MIILMTVVINGEEPEDKSIIGIAYDIKSTQNGYTFYLDDSSGKEVRCFNRTAPLEYGVYQVKGTPSDDGSMLFLNYMQEIDQNKF